MTTIDRLKEWASQLKRDVVALWIAGRSSLTPIWAKLAAVLVAGYALSPIDLIPDFIPVLGYLDDLILVPLGVALVVQLIPKPLMARFRQEAAEAGRPVSRWAAFAVIAAWVLLTLAGLKIVVGLVSNSD